MDTGTDDGSGEIGIGDVLMADWVEVASTDGWLPGTWKTVDIDDVIIAVFNLDGAFYAIEDVCTHDYDRLTGGKVEGEAVICPRHGARFSMISGKVLSAPAYEAINTFPVRIHDGKVQVKDER